MCDSGTICRLCMSHEDTLLHIFDSHNPSVQLPDRIYTCVSLKVEVDDGLPSWICERCSHHIDTWFEFKETCEKTDATLRQQINRDVESQKVEMQMTQNKGMEIKEELFGDNDFLDDSSNNDLDLNLDNMGDQVETHEIENYKTNFVSTKKKIRRKMLKCDVCQQEFTRQYLPIHFRVHSGERPYVCGICGETFRSLSNLGRHKQVHSGLKVFCCLVCGKHFSKQSSLKEHELHHSGDGNKRFMCQECGKCFTKRSSLQDHEARHLVGDDQMLPKRYLCKECGKRFTQRGALNTHEKLHSGEKPFSCKVCGKSFNRAGNLRTHLRSHSDERPFPCLECGKKFRLDGALKMHQRVHSGAKPFSCTLCEKSFGFMNSLRIHLNSHTGEKPYPCNVCQRRFTQQCHLKRHKKVMH